MKRLLLATLLVFGLAGATHAQTDDVSTGLRFAPASEYETVPLASSPFSGEELPASVDLSRSLPSPGNQGNQSSCVGWAVAYALKTYHEQRELNWQVEQSPGQPHPDRVFSPSFIYNQINNGQDGGSLFVDAFNVLSEQGAAPLSAMPYSAYNTPIPAAARTAARQYRINTWRRVNVQDLRELKAQLNAGLPVVIGALVDDGFVAMGPGQTWRSNSGTVRGGHAMLVVGYDDARNAFKLINSWGRQWGDNGYGWVDYDHFRRVTREAYVVQDARNGPAPNNPQPNPTDPYEPPPPQGGNANIVITQFMHNQMHPQFGPGAAVSGTIDIPSGVQGQAQIVINLAFQNGMPVQSLSPQFMLPNGQAATGTPPLPLNGSRVQTTWFAFIPYCALNVPKGQMCLPYPMGPPQQSFLVARTVLFINNFGVAEGQAVPFQLVL